MGYTDKFNFKKIKLSKINRKITLLFLITSIIAPAIAILYFYNVSIAAIPTTITDDQGILLKTIALMIIILIGINAGIISFIVSRSISKPIKKLCHATKEVEKGNYDIRLNIHTGDEIEELSNAFNRTTEALGKMRDERNEIDNAKTEFLSITSHELRSPMTPMKAQLQMLEQGYFGKLTKNQKDSLKIIIRNADRLDNIIVDFLEISRIESARLKFEFRDTDISEIVKDTAKFMEAFAKEKNLKLIVKTDDIPIFETDPDRISQVLRNLINNAIKFSEENSKIWITAKLKDNYVLFNVKDYGCGLTPNNQIRIFEPFYQVESISKRNHEGTGLGLAICRGIVESQKGKIWVESKQGNGSSFYFTIPLNPVRKIEPIKVLFSQKNILEKKIKEEFETVLDPLGIGEFEKLKNINGKINNIKNDEPWTEYEFDSIFIFDENANILDCNEKMYKNLGYSKGEMLSLNISDFDALESKKDIVNKIREVKKDGVISFKTIHKRKDGSAILVHESFQYIKDNNRFKGIVREDYSSKKSK